jgi:hypothetical protein
MLDSILFALATVGISLVPLVLVRMVIEFLRRLCPKSRVLQMITRDLGGTSTHDSPLGRRTWLRRGLRAFTVAAALFVTGILLERRGLPVVAVAAFCYLVSWVALYLAGVFVLEAIWQQIGSSVLRTHHTGQAQGQPGQRKRGEPPNNSLNLSAGGTLGADFVATLARRG